MKPMVFSLRVVLLLGSVGMFAFILYLIKIQLYGWHSALPC